MRRRGVRVGGNGVQQIERESPELGEWSGVAQVHCRRGGDVGRRSWLPFLGQAEHDWTSVRVSTVSKNRWPSTGLLLLLDIPRSAHAEKEVEELRVVIKPVRGSLRFLKTSSAGSSLRFL